jgi:hypothetical protein
MAACSDLAVVGLPAVVRQLLWRGRQGEVACVSGGQVPAETLGLGLALGVLEIDGPSWRRGELLYGPGSAAKGWLKREDKARRLATTAKRSGAAP